ncbi:hypothetical protein MNB_SV-9-601 [hydrothermal vent metagenome]|uniref:Transposase n=1 Tax=hydrothermal vent metagenome TaxID=652676 RepID=A0A1W1C4S6_9ZZZZ
MYKESLIYTAKNDGIKEGMERGIEKGIEKGKIEIAKKLLAQNIDLDIIVISTGLTIEEIENLRD